MIQNISFNTWYSIGKTNAKVTNSQRNIRKSSFSTTSYNKMNTVVRKDLFGTAAILELSHSYSNGKVYQKRPQYSYSTGSVNQSQPAKRPQYSYSTGSANQYQPVKRPQPR
jgi:hypothetical protein